VINGLLPAASTDCAIDGKTYCTIPANSTYCRFNKDGVLPASGNGFTIVSTPGTAAAPDVFTVPADTMRYYVAQGRQQVRPRVRRLYQARGCCLRKNRNLHKRRGLPTRTTACPCTTFNQ